jgi:hypothetical protein
VVRAKLPHALLSAPAPIVLGNHGSALGYEPNNYGEWQQQRIGPFREKTSFQKTRNGKPSPGLKNAAGKAPPDCIRAAKEPITSMYEGVRECSFPCRAESH